MCQDLRQPADLCSQSTSNLEGASGCCLWRLPPGLRAVLRKSESGEQQPFCKRVFLSQEILVVRILPLRCYKGCPKVSPVKAPLKNSRERMDGTLDGESMQCGTGGSAFRDWKRGSKTQARYVSLAEGAGSMQKALRINRLFKAVRHCWRCAAMRGMATYCALRCLVWHLPYVVSPSFDGCKRTVHRCSFCNCLSVLQGFQHSIVLMFLYLWYYPEFGILELDFCFALCLETPAKFR
jgi:hypothetical protein